MEFDILIELRIAQDFISLCVSHLDIPRRDGEQVTTELERRANHTHEACLHEVRGVVDYWIYSMDPAPLRAEYTCVIM